MQAGNAKDKSNKLESLLNFVIFSQINARGQDILKEII